MRGPTDIITIIGANAIGIKYGISPIRIELPPNKSVEPSSNINLERHKFDKIAIATIVVRTVSLQKFGSTKLI